MTLLMFGCGSGGSNKVIVIDDSLLVLPQIGEPLPESIIEYDKIASDVTGLQLTANQSTGQTLLWQSPDGFTGVLPTFSINVSDYQEGGGWGSLKTVKTNSPLTETRLVRDVLGDLHVSWFVPGREIASRSKVNNEWQGENLFTTNGSCLEVDSGNSNTGTGAIWCDINHLVNWEIKDSDGWEKIDNIDDQDIEKRNLSFKMLNNGNYLLSWVPPGFDITNQIEDYSLRVGEFDSLGVKISETSVTSFEQYSLPNNKIFTDKENSHLLVWGDYGKPFITELVVSIFNGVWSEPKVLNSLAPGYVKYDAHYLASGNIILLAHQYAINGLEIHYYNGNSWLEIGVIEDVTSFDAAVEENTLLLVYANELETKGIKIEAGTISDDIFKLEQKVNSIGVANLGSNKLMTVWTRLGDAYYTIIEY